MSLAGQAPTVPHLGSFPRLYLFPSNGSKSQSWGSRVCSGPQGVGGKEQERWGAGCVWMKGKTRKGQWRGRRGSGTR